MSAKRVESGAASPSTRERPRRVGTAMPFRAVMIACAVGASSVAAASLSGSVGMLEAGVDGTSSDVCNAHDSKEQVQGSNAGPLVLDRSGCRVAGDPNVLSNNLFLSAFPGDLRLGASINAQSAPVDHIYSALARVYSFDTIKDISGHDFSTGPLEFRFTLQETGLLALSASTMEWPNIFDGNLRLSSVFSGATGNFYVPDTGPCLSERTYDLYAEIGADRLKESSRPIAETYDVSCKVTSSEFTYRYFIGAFAAIDPTRYWGQFDPTDTAGIGVHGSAGIEFGNSAHITDLRVFDASGSDITQRIQFSTLSGVNYTAEPGSIPAPSSLVLFGLGFAGLIVTRRGSRGRTRAAR